MGETFLNLIETMDASDASVGRLFNSAAEKGQRRAQIDTRNPQYRASLYEALRLYADVCEGRRPAYQLREALTTSDFPLLFGDIIDRQLLANYRETPQTFRNYCKIGTVPDFRTVKRFAINGSEARLVAVQQQQEYPESKLTDYAFSYAVTKYGRSIPFSWEDMINDDLDALKDIPARFGRAARRTEEFFATGLFVDVNGPISTFYNTANKNRIHTENGASSNNPPLSIQALQDAMIVLDSQVDFDGEPIIIDSVELVVPPALRVIAENILNSTELWINLNSTATSLPQQQIHTQNWVKGMVRLNVNYYIPKVATTANGSTSWFLFANPSASRPAIEVGFLRGHTDPEVWMKEPDAMRIGGGGITPMDGDFDTDSIRYRVRHVMGGVVQDWKATVGSNGSGV
jgi:hypothetical protein